MIFFVDADSLIGLYDFSDKLHIEVERILEKLGTMDHQLPLSINVVSEVVTILSQRLGKYKALEILRDLRSGKYEIINLTDEIVREGENIFRKIISKNVSYSDCLSFAVCQKLNIQWVLSFDAHFKKQGFKRIGLDGMPRLAKNPKTG